MKTSVCIGETDLSFSEIGDQIYELVSKEGFKGENYNVLLKNCNHFCDSLGKKLTKSQKSVLPGWVNRTANLGGFFAAFVPEQYLTGQGMPNSANSVADKAKTEQKKSNSSFGGKGYSLAPTKNENNASNSTNTASQEEIKPNRSAILSAVEKRFSSFPLLVYFSVSLIVIAMFLKLIQKIEKIAKNALKKLFF